MSQTDSIMVRARGPMRALPPQVLMGVHTFLFEFFEALDAASGKAWRRLWMRLYRGEVDQLHLLALVNRHGKYHARHMLIERAIFESQDRYEGWELAHFRTWLKTAVGFGHFEAQLGELVFVPDSCSYDECSDQRMREFHEAAMEFLRSQHALAHLWPAVHPDQRLGMLEAAINGDPEK